MDLVPAPWLPGCKLLGVCLLLTSLATLPLSFLSQRSCHTGLLSVFLRLQALFCLLAFVYGESSWLFAAVYLTGTYSSSLSLNISTLKGLLFLIPLRGLLEPQSKAVAHLSLSPSTLYFIAFLSYVSESALWALKNMKERNNNQFQRGGTCVLSHLSRVQLFVTLWTGSSVHGIVQARILEWVAISFSRGSSQARDRTHIC